MNINKSLKIAEAVEAGTIVPQADMQAAFERLSKPDQFMSVAAGSARHILWTTGKVNLDD